MQVSVPWIVTHLNLITNICFVQLSLHPKSTAKNSPHSESPFCAFWVKKRLLDCHGADTGLWCGLYGPWAGSRLAEMCPCSVQAPVLGTLQCEQSQGWTGHPGRWLFIFCELTAWDLGMCCTAKPSYSVGMGCSFVQTFNVTYLLWGKDSQTWKSWFTAAAPERLGLLQLSGLICQPCANVPKHIRAGQMTLSAYILVFCVGHV